MEVKHYRPLFSVKLKFSASDIFSFYITDNGSSLAAVEDLKVRHCPPL
jgi:hypothetical protein